MWKKCRPQSSSAADHRLAVDEHVLLVEVPAARAHDGHGQIAVVERVLLAFGRGELERAAVRVVQSDTWPSITFAQCGVLASSRSASQTLAPEFSALIAILASVGPVISTRRSCSAGGAAATDPVGLADVAGLVEEAERAGLADLPTPRDAGGEQLVATRSEPALQVCDERQRRSRQDLVLPRLRGRRD